MTSALVEEVVIKRKMQALAYHSTAWRGVRKETMTSEDLVKAVKIQTSDAAVSGTIACLKEPPGRKPAEKTASIVGMVQPTY